MYRLLLIFATLTIFSCSGVDKEKRKTDNYENSKRSMADIERASPTRFLSASLRSKKNIIGQTVVKGKITSSAKMVTFKDVDITLRFYSKTGTLLEEDKDTVYDTIPPGKTVSFKSKYFAPKDTDSIAVQITDAKS